MRALYRGFRMACLRYGFEVTGGDLARGPAWVIAITMIGRLEAGGRPLLRSGAKPGDRVWVSGCPGRAAAGLAALKRWPRTEVPRRYRPLTGSHVNPQARPELGALLAANPLVHAAIDISDGVAKEARTIAHMSGARCELRLPGTCPCAPMQALAAELGENWEEWMLYGGEDYELLFTASPAFDPRELPEPTLCIGQIVKGTGACIEHSGRRTPLGAGSWDHFSAR
jgi:thiamine-monophosphate kinase